ncbi:TPA: alpha,alpha-phosphotrehalase [Pasteurella multocida]|uniref:alpha,alpha-phosphotrehalase n=1 Tax=Pasteurella multocida TaxID=747 RepID=UPI0009F741B4|nr:alpha,alpha-phosphotrehalase [Pasteurella multocida]MEB3483690.1 alpha,alpha-phosphotrehalase [Pasteurella multocida]MEB3493869.1 alpha,alpha-phosphotrehalase [Pasteurella multocida]PNM03890.1 alpha,alpha-phosphotrehalase [Pasteurella multocida]HDR0967081.1 alpha,alpha-phosphotrehalase [Pasteurella multocida]HDR0968858.1 alpha,alpha-phosphotrehalase [Pasteurella multocida]
MSSKNWWQNGVIYQIYPKSFQDTTGSGIGDIQGIIKRLDYLKELGIDGLWITPMYVSPQIDNGYDIANYRDIDPSYGSMTDFEQLIAQAHQRDIKIVMDMVFNHSSTFHPWFVEGEDPNSAYHDYYIWREEPTNWKSKFGGSAWKWSDKAQKYYLHLFAPEQADLNWENPKLREELFAICQFWAEKGIDGLRLDVVNLISKPEQFEDDSEGDGRRFYTDGPKIHQYLQLLNQRALTPYGLMTVGEMSSTTLENCQQYANLAGTELSMTFNFHHLKVDYPKGEKWSYAKPDYVQLKSIFNYWQQGMHGQAWNALFWCNHDQPRIVSRFGDEGQWHQQSAKMLAMILHGLQGTPYIYQGEEFGMTNPNFTTIEQYRDVESLNAYTELREQGIDETLIMQILAQKSRDNGRTPMQWDDSEQAGFTTGTAWIDVAKNYPHINAKAALADKNSVFYTYKALIALRKKLPVLTEGNYQDLAPEHPALWCYQRQTTNEKLLVLANLSELEQVVELPQVWCNQHTICLMNNYDEHVMFENKMILKPYQAVYLYK